MGYEWKAGRLFRNGVATDWRVSQTEEGWLATHPATATHAEVAYHDDTEAEAQAMAVTFETNRVLARLRAAREGKGR